jgi:signal transduction histidine kinase
MSQDPVKSQNYVGTLRRETGRLTDLIEDLLTISRLEAGRVDIEIQPVNVDNLVADLVRDRAPMASKRQLNLEYKPSAGLPIASADPRLLTQVLSNLLTNALNYTPAGGSIWIFTEPEPGGGGAAGWIWIHVRDNGVGISEQDQPHLFERFFRGTASRITGAPGTGLGLAISKEIVERLGGGITVESQTGQGSTFTIWLKSML